MKLLAFNVPTVWLTRLLRTHRHTIRWKHYLSQFTSFTWRT